ncbi:MAG: IS607 family transposase [Cetobacterium sp.]
MIKYVNTKEAREITRVTSATLRRWDKEDKVKTIRTSSGIRLYDKSSLLAVIGQKGDSDEKKSISYCRVSSKKQNDDLERQKDFMQSLYPDHELVSDVGSGINFKRKGLQRILEQVMQGKVEEVVVSHRDRLCRFAFELIEFIFKQHDTKLVVIDKTDNKSGSEELAEDVLAIIQVFACREMGKRRYKSSKAKTTTDEKAETDS